MVICKLKAEFSLYTFVLSPYFLNDRPHFMALELETSLEDVELIAVMELLLLVPICNPLPTFCVGQLAF